MDSPYYALLHGEAMHVLEELGVTSIPAAEEMVRRRRHCCIKPMAHIAPVTQKPVDCLLSQSWYISDNPRRQMSIRASPAP
jgi:hypothetical protein